MLFRAIENFKHANGCLFVSLISEDKKSLALNEATTVTAVADSVISHITC